MISIPDINYSRKIEYMGIFPQNPFMILLYSRIFIHHLQKTYVGNDELHDRMARDIPEPDDVNTERKRPIDGDTGGNNSIIDRRSYLKLAGATTAAAAVTGVAGASDGEEYEVIEADNSNYFLDEGEVFENKIIDFSNGNWFTIIANTTNWTIRNVGFRGVHDHDHNAIVARDEGGNTSTIENVYLGDGCIRPDSYSSHGQCGIFVHRGHTGHLDVRNVYVEDWPNNGIYASAAAYDTPGTVTLENCFGKNNYVASLRVSDGGRVVDCVAYNDGTGRYQGRPFWGWGDQEVVGCDLDGGSYSNGASIFGRDGSETYVEDTRHSGYNMSGSGQYSDGSGVRSNGGADLSVPEGVPTSPTEAAAGTSSGGSRAGRGDHDDLQHTYEFVAEGQDESTDYYFEIEDGPIEPSTYNGATIEEELTWVSDDGTRAAGRVVDGRHAWEFDTMLVDVTVDGPAEPIVNDQQSHLSRYPRDGATGDDWKDLDELLAPDEFEYEVEAAEDDVEYFLEAKEGVDFTPLDDSEYVYVSADGTRAAGLLADGDRHGFTGYDVDPPAMLDVTIRGDGMGYIGGDESSLGWYPQDGASGDDWKDLDELLDLDDEGGNESDDDFDGGDDSDGNEDDWWNDLFGDDEWWDDGNDDGDWLEDFLRTLKDRWTN